MELSDRALRMNKVGMDHEHKHKWSVEKRIEVVTKTLALGNMRLVSELTGVSYQLIREWKQAPWWAELVQEIQSSRNAAVGSKLGRLVDLALTNVEDKLINGNVYLDKQGNVQRKELTALEANKIAETMLNQETLVQKREALVTQDQKADSMADIIRDLAKQFAAFNTRRTVENVPSALHDQRQEGLQETIREVRLEAEEHPQEERGQQSSFDGDEDGESSQGGRDGRGPHQATEQGWEDGVPQSESGDSPSESFFFTQQQRHS